jgi:alkyl sulfatase BDS1-like metallo-beta-lactamase superfamily hydrolase
MGADMIRNTPSNMIMDLLAVRLNADKVGEGHVAIDLTFADRKEHFRLTVRNGVLVATDRPLPGDGPADLTVTMARQDFLFTAFGPVKLADRIKSGAVQAQGDVGAYDRLVSWLDSFKADFPILWRP